MTLREQIVAVAKTYIGTPYKELDCSAFVAKPLKVWDGAAWVEIDATGT